MNKHLTKESIKTDDTSAVLNLKILGRGENAIRMEKRLRCAARSLGVRVMIDWQAKQHGKPKVYYKEKLIVDHLLTTENLEDRLKQLLSSELKA